jgi:hypothetical protein
LAADQQKTAIGFARFPYRALRDAKRRNPNAVQPLLALPQKLVRCRDPPEPTKKQRLKPFIGRPQRDTRRKISIVAFWISVS